MAVLVWIPDSNTVDGQYNSPLRGGTMAVRGAMMAMAHRNQAIPRQYTQTPGYERLVG